MTKARHGNARTQVPPKPAPPQPERKMREMLWNKARKSGMLLVTVGTTEILFHVAIRTGRAFFSEVRQSAAGVEVCLPLVIELFLDGNEECSCQWGQGYTDGKNPEPCLHVACLRALKDRELI